MVEHGISQDGSGPIRFVTLTSFADNLLLGFRSFFSIFFFHFPPFDHGRKLDNSKALIQIVVN